MDGKLVNQIVSWAFGCVNIMILIRHWYHKTSYRRRDRKFPFQSKAEAERFTRKWFHHHIYFHTIQTHLYEEFWTWLRFKTWGKNQWLIENFFLEIKCLVGSLLLSISLSYKRNIYTSILCCSSSLCWRLSSDNRNLRVVTCSRNFICSATDLN